MERFSDLSRLVKTIAWVWRAARKFLGGNRTLNNPKWEAVSSTGTITMREREDALRDIFLAAQEGITFPNTTRDRLVIYKDPDSGLLVWSVVAECRSLKKIKLAFLSFLTIPGFPHYWLKNLTKKAMEVWRKLCSECEGEPGS